MDQETLTGIVGVNVYYIIEFIGFFIFSFTGSFVKELYLTNTSNGEHEFVPYRVIMSTLIASFGSLAFKGYFLNTPEHSWMIMIFVSFVFGLLGFEIFQRLSTIDGVKSLASDIHDIAINIWKAADGTGKHNHSHKDKSHNKHSGDENNDGDKDAHLTKEYAHPVPRIKNLSPPKSVKRVANKHHPDDDK